MRGILVDNTQPPEGKRQQFVEVEQRGRHHIVNGVKYSRITGYAMGSRKVPGDFRRRLYVEGEFSYEERARRTLGTLPGHYWYVHPVEGEVETRDWTGKVLRTFDAHLAPLPDEEEKP